MDKGKINLLYINHSFDVGGIEVLILNMCRVMDKNKYNISVCSFSESNSLDSEFRKAGFSFHVIKRRLGIDISLIFKLRSLCRKLDIDIINTHNAGQWFYAVLACLGKRSPAVVHTQHTVHQDDARRSGKDSHGMLLRSLKYLAKRTNSIICIARYISDYLIARAEISADKIKVVYNGTDINKIPVQIDRRMKKESLGIRHDSFTVGIIARLTPKKGHDILLTAFKMVRKNIPNAQLVIVGGGELLHSLKEYSEQLGLKDCVVFLGNRRDVPELLKIIDLFVLSSYSEAEGLSVALLEAMAAGVPVISTDSGGNREAIIDGLTGIIVPPGDPCKLSDAICSILQNKQTADKFINNGIARHRELFSLEVMVRQYSEIYERAVYETENAIS